MPIQFSFETDRRHRSPLCGLRRNRSSAGDFALRQACCEEMLRVESGKEWGVGMVKAVHMVGAVAFWALGAQASATENDPAFGHWLVESGRAIVEIGPCAGVAEGACGRLAWIARPHERGGALRRDVNNPDQALRDRPLCGATILTDLERDDDGSWRDGDIYDARSGSTYDVNVEAQDDGSLKVHGFLGWTLLGKSQYWKRISGARGGCELGAPTFAERPTNASPAQPSFIPDLSRD